jgi:hypothetical protein
VCLGHEHAIERVAVDQWQSARGDPMAEGDRQFAEAAVPGLFRQVDRLGQLSDRLPDRDLPE